MTEEICSICEKKYRRDRFSVTVKIERQDIPNESNWSTSFELPTEYICPKCYDTLLIYYGHVNWKIREGKGEYKA